jgi:hypothetical protein
MRGGFLKYLARAVEAHRPQKAMRDVTNLLLYGRSSPLSDMAIFPAAAEVNFRYVPRARHRLRRQHSGRVLAGNWDESRADVNTEHKLVSCRMRWQEGADWEETPIYRTLIAKIEQGYVPDGCRTREDLNERYARLDHIFHETRARGRLLRMAELPDDFYRREHGATLIHVARDGTCLRSGGGAHRFAIAKILDLPEFPAQLGVIHPDALRAGHLDRLRKSASGR